ncbi:GP46-like surface antigen, putative [Bodo saltans]|uniref:GP46-like surface antigen, putative n=1 Tax=Bodo saltans TaxID=75058 RepID=A0A0S4J0S0_BODSA|nr:GP46-like surface antigen, putative [Bodo saltans]|eukprot:CUG45132.1 GP46-like surface antigen, putative [Bodo saltans]
MSQFVRGQRLTAFSARRHRWISATTSFQWMSLFLLACLFVAAESDNIITISQVEVEALREFVTAINLNYNGSRLNTTNACTTELPGMVECNATGITQLNFTSRNLTGTLPANLSKLTQLRDVIVYNNRLHGTIPTEYSRWGQSIRSFSLYTNNFTGTLPSSFRNWTLVQVFDAHENQLSGTLPDEYSEWRNLTTLLLAQNRLTGTLPAKYSTWGSSIKYFEVENNNFNGSMPPDYSNFTNLTSFYVSDCGLSGTLPESYAQMTRLESLRCSSNQLTGTLPHSYGNQSNMIVFVVQNNSLTGTLPEAYSSWRGLVYFAADNNKFTGTLPAAYSNWSSVTQFYIHNNILNGSLPPAWGSWTQVSTFTARNNSFTGPLPSNYASWRSLQTIDVSHNQLNGTMLEGFAAWGENVTSVILANNNLSGTVPSTWCTTMKKLALWNIANNLFEGPLSFGCIFSTFIAFAFSSNNISGAFPFDNFPFLIVLDAQNNTHLSGTLTSSVWLQIASTCGTALCAEASTSATLTCLPSGFVANQADDASPSQIVMEAKSYNISTSICPQTVSPSPAPPSSTLAPPPPLTAIPQPNTLSTTAATSVAGITTASAAVSAMFGADAAEAQMLVSILGSPCTCSGGTSATSDGSVLLLALSPFSPLGSSWAAIGNSLLCCALFGVHVLGVCVLDALAATAEHTSPKRQSVPFYRPDTSFLGRWRSSQRGRRGLLMRLRFPNLSVSLVLLLIPGVVRAVMSVINNFSSGSMDDVALSVVAIVIGVVFLATAAAALELLVYRHIDTEVLLAKGEQQQDSLTVQGGSLRSQQRGHKQFRSNDASGALLLHFINHVHLETVFSPLPRNISRVVLPSGFWTPPSARKAYGTMVSSLTDAGRRWWCALPVVNAIVQVLNSVSGGGSRACDALQSLTMVVLACACVFFAVVRPHRALLASYLTCVSLLLSCLVTLLAMLCRLGSVGRSAVDGFGVFVSVAMMVMKAYQAGVPYMEAWLRRRNGFTGANAAAMKYFFGSLFGDVDEVPQIGEGVRVQRKSTSNRPSRFSSETIRELLSLKYNQDEALKAVVYLVCSRNAQTQRAGFQPSINQETKK